MFSVSAEILEPRFGECKSILYAAKAIRKLGTWKIDSRVEVPINLGMSTAKFDLGYFLLFNFFADLITKAISG